MKAKKRELRTAASLPVAPPRPARWPWFAAAAAAFILVFWAYGPAMHGPFLFDDTSLPYYALLNVKAPLSAWVGSVRPFLMFTYWVNNRMGQDDTYSFHVFNVLFHLISSGLVFFIVRRMLEWSGAERARNNLLAGFAAAVFLLHPVQTEAVAYLAGRSESLCTMFVLAAFTLFLYRPRPAASWTVVIALFALFGLALLSKENAVALPALFLLTDYWWNPGFSFQGIRNNWKLYLPMAIGAAAGVRFFWHLITTSTSAGFGMKDLTWYQYFFTQCRALFVYLGMFLFPARLTADWDFAISRTILDRGAIAGLIGLVALAVLAWIFRHRFPLASYGYFAFLILMAPTSSVLPIRDPIAERRLYFAMFALLLIVVDLLSRLKVERKALAGGCAVVVLLAAIATHARAAVWSDPVLLWQDTVQKSPDKSRPHFQLGMAYFLLDTPQYDRAIPEFERTAQLGPAGYDLLLDWGLALDGLGRTDQALAKLRQAAALDATAHVYSQIAKVYASNEHWPEALDALATAEKIDSNWVWIYIYRGKIFLHQNRLQESLQQYRRALQIEPANREALHDLNVLQGLILQQQAAHH